MIGIGKWDLLRPGLRQYEKESGLELDIQMDFVADTMKLVAYNPMTKKVKEALLFTVRELEDGSSETLRSSRFKAAISEVIAP